MCDDVSCYGMSCEEFEKDLLRCDDLLARLDPTWRRKKWRWFRPPRGYLNEDMLEPLNRLGYRVALADVFPALTVLSRREARVSVAASAVGRVQATFGSIAFDAEL